jgi:hypothetical protein
MTCQCLLPCTVLCCAAQGDNTALHWAAMRGHVEVVRALLAGGADRSVTNKQGLTPVELCQPVWSLSWRFTQEVLSA